MSQYSIYDVPVLATCDDSDGPTAAAANLDVDAEHTFQALNPGHCDMTLDGCAEFCVGDGLVAFPAPGWCNQPSPAVVRGKDAVVAGEIDPRLRYQSSQPRNEIYRVEGYLGRSIPVGRLQGIDHLASGTE